MQVHPRRCYIAFLHPAVHEGSWRTEFYKPCDMPHECAEQDCVATSSICFCHQHTYTRGHIKC